MKVRANSVYVYHPTLMDRYDAKTTLQSGDVVRVKNMHGCPRANTMGHCHVVNAETGQFIGLVCCNSLHTRKAYDEYLRSEAVVLGTY